MKLSLIVATRNRTKDLSRLLESLVKQSHKDFEVIIVDQSDDASAEDNRRLAVQYGRLSVVYTRQLLSGVSRARNLGLKLVSGEVVAFPDDDCWYDPSLLERVVAHLGHWKDCEIISGICTEPGVYNPMFPARPCRLHFGNGITRFSSVTFFVRTSALKRLDVAFDEDLGAGAILASGEEIDFVLELLAKGVSGRYEPSLVVYHKIEAAHALSEKHWNQELCYAYVLARFAHRPTVAARVVSGLLKAGFRSAFSLADRRKIGARIEGFGRALRARGQGRNLSVHREGRPGSAVLRTGGASSHEA